MWESNVSSVCNPRITKESGWGLGCNNLQKRVSYVQAVLTNKSYTLLILSFKSLTHSSTQFSHMNTAFTTTPDCAFAHLHTPNNKE